jgi:hypothetical protein
MPGRVGCYEPGQPAERAGGAAERRTHRRISQVRLGHIGRYGQRRLGEDPGLDAPGRRQQVTESQRRDVPFVRRGADEAGQLDPAQ